jgi:hypothetical protein
MTAKLPGLLSIIVLCWLSGSSEAAQKTCVLQWQPVPGAVGYRVHYRTLNIDVQNVTQVMLAGVGIDQPGQTEQVQVGAYNANGEGTLSAVVTVTIDPLPSPPTPLAQVTGVQVACP